MTSRDLAATSPAVEGLDSDEDDEDEDEDEDDSNSDGVEEETASRPESKPTLPDRSTVNAAPPQQPHHHPHVSRQPYEEDEWSAPPDDAYDTDDDSLVSVCTSSSSSSSSSPLERPPRGRAPQQRQRGLPAPSTSSPHLVHQGAPGSLEARVIARFEGAAQGLPRREASKRGEGRADSTAAALAAPSLTEQKHRRGHRKHEAVSDDFFDEMVDDLEDGSHAVDSKPSRRSIWHGFCTRKEISRFLRNRRKTVRTTLCTMLGLYVLGLLFAAEGSLDGPSDQVPAGLPGQLQQGKYMLRGGSATRRPPTDAEREELRRSLPREALRAAGFDDETYYDTVKALTEEEENPAESMPSSALSSLSQRSEKAARKPR